MRTGGGYLGLELAQAMRRLGSQVTVIESSAHLLSREDEDVQEGLRALLADEGIELQLAAKVVSVSGRSGKKVQLHLERAGVDAGEIMGTRQLAMVGNLPCTAVRDAILTHPTLREGLVVLFSSAPRTLLGTPGTVS